jgi:hypothetical protein
MRRRRRRNNPSVSNTLGWVVLGIGAVVAYEIYKNGSTWLTNFLNQFKPGSGPTSIGTEVYEGITGKSPCAPMVATGGVVFPSGASVPSNCLTLKCIPGTNTTEAIDNATGEVGYLQEGQGSSNGYYSASANPPACQCYSAALQSYSC